MELNTSFIDIQGILLKLKQDIGDFTRINYKGGNEDKINKITTEFETYFISKNYINDGEINKDYSQKLNEIIMFLAINTDFKKHPSFTDYSHLINIIPPLSKCVLANICYNLNLITQYCYIIEKFPIDLTEELLDQISQCLKKAKPKTCLPIVFSLLKSVAKRISEVELCNKTEEIIDDIIVVLNVILQILTGLFSDQVKTMKIEQIYQHMGFTLLNLLDFLLYIDEKTCALKKLLEPVFGITCNVVKSITLDVFCEWAEVEYDEQPLQIIIAGKAYLVMEKYKKNKLASELNSLLSNIARKPKTVLEQIQEADIDTIIKKVNIKDENQRQWFKAILNTRVFNDPKIVECLSQWWSLCDESDVDRVLNLPLPNNEKHRKLILQCAKNISVGDLKGILTIYFYRHKFVWKEDIQTELIILFNQAQNIFTDDDLKTILLMILQNAYQFFTYFFGIVFKASLEQYKQVLELVNDILKIDNIGLNIILKMLEEKIPSSLNVDKYLNLFNILIDCKIYSWDFIVSNMIIPLTDCYKLSADSVEGLGGCIHILKKFSHLQCEINNERNIVEFMLICASDHRCKSFIEFVPFKEEIVRNCVEYIIEQKLPPQSNIGQDLNDPWTNYYKDIVLKNDIIKLMDYLIPNFDLSLYSDNKADENITKLLKVLPRCAAPEWKIITSEIEEKCGYKISINAITDIIILLCDVTNQSNNSQDGSLVVGLQFCLEMFGSYISQSMNKSKAEQVLAINNMCRLLKHLPSELKQTNGIVLVNLLPAEPLKDLATDKEFLARIIMINDKQICKVLAEKMLK